MNLISAEIIADSKNVETGGRATTFVLKFPRIVLAEFNTHRMISKNSASSRAIPFEKMIKYVKETPFIPIKFMKNHSGMQGDEYFIGEEEEKLRERWLEARDWAVVKSRELFDMGLTKQLVNRTLEPYLYHTVIATGTDWENFFKLRAHGAAEIHIEDLAKKMLVAYNESTPKNLKLGEWHIPFGDKFDNDRLAVLAHEEQLDKSESEKLVVKIATARCARVSYMNFDGKDDYKADVNLHDRLAQYGHWSPFEHCAKASNDFRSGNFTGGFTQYRKEFINENQSDDRVLRK